MGALCFFAAGYGKDGSAAVLEGHHNTGRSPQNINDDSRDFRSGADRKLAGEEQHVQSH